MKIQKIISKFISIYKNPYILFIYLGDKVKVYKFKLKAKDIKIWGEGSYGYPEIISYDGVSKLSVGGYCSIADGVTFLLGANHRRDFITTFPECLLDKTLKVKDCVEEGSVIVGNDVWIGYGATIIGPVKIGDGAIIGARAVVVKDVPPYSVVVGSPARVVKYRFSESEIVELLKIKWWDRKDEKILSDIFKLNIQDFIKKYS